MMKNLKKCLEEIKDREYALRKLKSVYVGGTKYTSGRDLLESHRFAPVISFLIYARYVNVFDFDDIRDVIDIPISLSQSGFRGATKLLQLWNKIASNYPYTLNLIDILKEYNLNSYQSEENDVIISKYVNNCILFAGIDDLSVTSPYNVSTSYNIIEECEFQLGIENKLNDAVLISVENGAFIQNSLKRWHGTKLIFTDCGRYDTYVQVAIGFLEIYKDCQFVKSENGKFFPFDDAKFNGVYYQRIRNDNPVSLDNLMNYVKDDGFCVAFNQSRSRVGNAFMQYEIPLVLDIYDFIVVVCRKKADEKERVRYGSFFVNDAFSEAEYWKNVLVSVIKTNGHNDDFQILTKDDFRYAKNKVDFNSIRRDNDQLNFVWKNLDDIITIKDSEEEVIHNSDSEISHVITWNDMSSNPFQIKADSNKYTRSFDNICNKSNTIIEECELNRINNTINTIDYNFSIPQKYDKLFREAFREVTRDNVSKEAKVFEKMLCYRLITTPTLLYGWHRVLRVDASKTRPVCIKKCSFHCEESEGDAWYCTSHVDAIEISHEYDENFIIYQIIKGNDHHGHILVAPTKEEQRTFFINKRLEYLSQYQPVVNEMEDEIKHAIAISDSRISGVGLTNFRRFTNLELLPLSGVNILVGGNNAGKSTFVKGLLLGLDNIKSLTPQAANSVAGGRILYFQLDSNNIHDVHVGTFNRAYSTKCIQTKNHSCREMGFKFRISHFTIEVIISPNDDKVDITSIPISKICVTDEKRKASFDFNYFKQHVTMNYEMDGESQTKNFAMLLPDSSDGKMNIIASSIRGIADYISSNNEEEDNDWSELQCLRGKTGFLIEIASELDGIITNTQVEYIYAHGINQKILFNYNDKNDFMAITLHDLMIEHISSDEKTFICTWMENFGIGKDYDITSIGGEAYSIQLKNMNDDLVYLADMGMGASQLLVLIFRLAIIIHRQRMRGKSPYRPTIIIEEPEQNMHPAYQSKLAEFFYEVHNLYGFNFIVETHSEYLVRKSQVIVAQQNYKTQESLNKKNPFKVYYFPTNGNPYEMEYRIDGNFSNDFGSGFYDEANNLLFEII